MQKVKLVLVLIMALGLATSAAAQTRPRTIASVQPIAFSGLGIGNVELEHADTGSTAWAIRVDFLGNNTGDWRIAAAGAGAAYRLFLSDPSPLGFWLGPSLDLLQYQATFREENQTALYVRPGFELGYTFLLGDALAFAISPQLSLAFLAGNLAIQEESLPYTGFVMNLGISLGLGF